MILGALHLWRRDLKPFSIFCAVFFLGYVAFYLIIHPQVMFWYFVPYFFMALLLAGLGAWLLIDAALTRWAKSRAFSPRTRTACVAAISAAFAAISLLTASNLSISRGFRAETAWDGLAFRYRDIKPKDLEALYMQSAARMNRWIEGNHQRRVGCPEIGIFGYHFKGRVLDAFGLVSPEVLEVSNPQVAAQVPESCRGVFPLDIFLVTRPEYILSADMFIPPIPPAFEEVYTELVWPDIPLRLFARNDMLDTVTGVRFKNDPKP